MSVRADRIPPSAWLAMLLVSGFAVYSLQSGALAQHWSSLLLEIQNVQRDLHREPHRRSRAAPQQVAIDRRLDGQRRNPKRATRRIIYTRLAVDGFLKRL